MKDSTIQMIIPHVENEFFKENSTCYVNENNVDLLEFLYPNFNIKQIFISKRKDSIRIFFAKFRKNQKRVTLKNIEKSLK